MIVLILAALFCSQTLYELETQAGQIKYPKREWTALMPCDDIGALLNSPTYLDKTDEGSCLDVLDMHPTGKPGHPANQIVYVPFSVSVV
jgi:hypothetical protein